jgi:PAS domain S-box-containing protein
MFVVLPHQAEQFPPHFDGDGVSMTTGASQSVSALSRFFDELDEQIVVVDRTGRIASANRSLQRFLGLSEAEIVGGNIASMVHAGQAELMRAYVEYFFARAEPCGEIKQVSFDLDSATDGLRRSASFRWSLLPDANLELAVIAIAVVELSAPMNRHLADESPAPSQNVDPYTPAAHTPAHQALQLDGEPATSERRSCTAGTRPLLSARERQIMQLVLQGKRVSTIAESLYLSENTVRNHLKRVYRKLGVSSIGELRERVQPSRKAS